ncbi:DUF221-domain-containing protein [Piromyces finnis]|uniref:DUF221-domain-containing protein n=1 Tax=Piromyces finnis TaxID=1754191 RepID=A0A1Y1VLG4_9FUNG|nr:DUF221-domain-containing protein [Piromyces finnis]|eukprot:ORX59307.1 DUF221-domain-containing protein [Piromyces finnis]
MSDVAVEDWEVKDSSIKGVAMQLVLSAVMTSAFVTVFIILRNTSLGKPVYSPRIINIQEESPPFSKKAIDWLKSLFKYDDSFILDNISLDAVMLMNFYRMGIYVCLIGSLTICPILASLDYFSHTKDTLTRVVNGTQDDSNSLSNRSFHYDNQINLNQINMVRQEEYDVFYHFKRNNDTEDAFPNEDVDEEPTDGLDAIGNYTEEYTLGLNMSIQVFSIANVPDGSLVFIAHSACCYFFSFVVMFFLWRNYKIYAQYYKETIRKGGLIRMRAIKTEVLQSKTVMIRNIPSNLQDKYSLIDWFNNLKVGKVDDIHIIYEANAKLTNAINKRRNNLYNLEKAYLAYKKNIDKNAQEKNFIRKFIEKKVLKKFPNALNNLFNPGGNQKEEESDPEYQRKKELRKLRPSHFTGTLFPLNGKFVDSISTYEANIEKYTKQIKQLRNEEKEKEDNKDDKKRAYTAFVTFKDTRAAHIVSQLSLYTSDNKNTMYCIAAPNPTNLQWENLHDRIEKKQSMSTAISVALFFMCIFYMVPVHFILAFTELEKLQEIEFLRDFIQKITQYELVDVFFRSLLPTILINVLLSLVPTIIYLLTKFEYFEAISMREKSFLKKYYLFILFNVLFICTLSKTFWGVLENAINDPKSIITLLGEQLPKGANFFILFIIYRIQSPANDLAALAGIVIGWLKRKFIFKTKRQIWDYEHTTIPLNYGLVYPMPLLIFTIILVYSCISSFILIPGVLYFFFNYLNQKNHILYINVKQWENNGVYYNLIFNRIIFALLVSQLTLVGMFWIKENGNISTSLIPLVIITIIFYKYCQNTFADIHKNTPIDQFTDGQNFSNCKSALLTSTYENLEKDKNNCIVRRTSSQVSLSKEDLKNCMQEAIDSNLRDRDMIQYLKGQLDSLVNSEKFKNDNESNNYLQVPQKSVKMPELDYLNHKKDTQFSNSSILRNPENNYGASEYIYITAQKNRKAPQYSCLAESELPQIPEYYLEAEYDHPDMTSKLYTPWIPDGLDESLIERSEENIAVDNNNESAVIDINDKNQENDKDKDNENRVINIDDDDDDDDDDKPLTNDITSKPLELKEGKSENLVVDVNNNNNVEDESDENIYLSLPNTAIPESPLNNIDNQGKRGTVYLDLQSN